MNLVRIFFSVFLIAFLVICFGGWVYAGGMSTSQMTGARAVLVLSALSAVGCLWMLWSTKPQEVVEPAGADHERTHTETV